jgi:hypothetical protein
MNSFQKTSISKFIIIEGPDRCGKDTQQNLIIKNLKDRVFHKLHYSNLPFKDDSQLNLSYSIELYNSMFNLMLTAKKESINLIFNRSHLGESVYAPLYRGYSGDYVFNIEKKYVNSLRENLYLITLIDNPDNIFSRDDGNSLFKNIHETEAEINGFVLAHKKSNIKNKLLINIAGLNETAVSNIIFDYLSHQNKVEGHDKQLSLFPDYKG